MRYKGYELGDTAWFILNGVERFGTISRIYELGGILKVDIICPSQRVDGISIEALYHKPPECKVHNTRKPYHDKENKYFCPFCES